MAQVTLGTLNVGDSIYKNFGTRVFRKRTVVVIGFKPKTVQIKYNDQSIGIIRNNDLHTWRKD